MRPPRVRKAHWGTVEGTTFLAKEVTHMGKLKVLLLVGIGYVLGAKAGRARYEQIKNRYQQFATNPKVQSTVAKANAKRTLSRSSRSCDRCGSTTSSRTRQPSAASCWMPRSARPGASITQVPVPYRTASRE